MDARRERHARALGGQPRGCPVPRLVGRWRRPQRHVRRPEQRHVRVPDERPRRVRRRTDVVQQRHGRRGVAPGEFRRGRHRERGLDRERRRRKLWALRQSIDRPVRTLGVLRPELLRRERNPRVVWVQERRDDRRSRARRVGAAATPRDWRREARAMLSNLSRRRSRWRARCEGVGVPGRVSHGVQRAETLARDVRVRGRRVRLGRGDRPGRARGRARQPGPDGEVRQGGDKP